METADHLRTGVDAALQRRGWPRTGSVEWDFLDRTGFLVDAAAEDDPAAFLAEEIRELRHEVDAMAAERAPVPAGTRSPVDLASRIQAELEASEPAGDDDRPGLWERARAAALLFYLERTGRAPTEGRRSGSASAPSDEAAAFEIAHPVRVLGITTVGEWQATTKVTLALDPTLSAAQVAAMWQKVRSAVLRQGARGRTVSRKSLALALFVAHHPGRTWADLRRMWNQLYAHWAFKSPDLRVFRNAAVRARRYLIEPPELDDMDSGRWQWVQRQAARLASGANSS
ncbi:MAG TPA: hypothetical protein VK215_05120 [Acidimicrobiales bacterium]|nr:hypothetical protein [Acidimicrobiales bacterium]HLN41807.1 hypothetical protein [Acidimicrobiales bacterium]